MRRAALAVALLALAVPSSAAAGRFAVGLERGASPAAVAERVRQVSGGTVSTIAPFALALQAQSARGVAGVAGVAYVERLERTRRLSFTPTDPLAKRQWYLDTINAFDFWPVPVFRAGPPVLVAVVDSGIDGSHPEFDGMIADARSFVDNQPRKDAEGHGTFVAGVIAAAANNGQGIAGIGSLAAKLLVAKVVRADGTISPEAEAKAIRWAVDRGARVINLSLGGTRDPLQPGRDTFSFLEASAIDYAVLNDVVVVAAVGNGDQAPSFPWRYANYPAALAHVIGVSAVARDDSVPSFSNSDAVYNDVSAPGEDILSTLPRALTDPRPLCEEQGYSPCGPREFKRGDGTSFAAPQVSAAVALMLSEKPSLAPEQVSLLLRRSVADVTSATCRQCGIEHDAYSGWGRLDIAAAAKETQGLLPRIDQFEPNDEAGYRAASLRRRKPILKLHATLDYWDDRTDVYRIRLKRGERFSARVNGLNEVATNLRLFRPGTRALQRRIPGSTTRAVRRTTGYGLVRRLPPYRAAKSGWHYLEVKVSAAGWGRYSLEIRRQPVQAFSSSSSSET
jgi:subtilase family protein